MTRLLAEQTAASLDSVDLILRAAAGQERRPSWRRSRRSCATSSRASRTSPRSACSTRKASWCCARARSPAFDPDVAERPFFVAHRDGKADVLHLSEPYRVAPAGSGASCCRGGSATRAAHFAGVVAAAIDLEAFDRLYRAIDLGEGGFITLLSNKGTLITRVPDPGNVRGRKFPGGRIMAGGRPRRPLRRLDARARSPTSACCSPPRAVRGFPLLVASGANEARGVRAVARRGLAGVRPHAAHLGGDARADRARRLGPRAARARARRAAGSATRR